MLHVHKYTNERCFASHKQPTERRSALLHLTIAKNLFTDLVNMFALWGKNAFIMQHLDWFQDIKFPHISLINVVVLMFCSRMAEMWLVGICIGTNFVFTDSVSCLDYIKSVIDYRINMEHLWYDKSRDKPKYRRRIFPRSTLSTTNSTCPGLG